MLPSILSREVRTGIRRFLQSTFPCSTRLFEGCLERLLDGEGKVFKGPYYGMRLPFRADESGGSYFSHVTYPFRPHRHQALAFERLRGDAPPSTLIATGTGSGKTECFLYPMLDYVIRNRRVRGIKAIVIYPMNALATDQAKRFARAVAGDPLLQGQIRVGMYVGGEGDNRKMMSADGVITDRPTLRNDPPDILLTNYKMLDYLLIRPDDLGLWRYNDPESLKFIVVDELHTFDGAQATDLGCLLRRLRARLQTPAGHLCCIGTSATIGGDSESAALLEYAGDLFGQDFSTTDAIIREHLLSLAEFADSYYIKHTRFPGREAADALRPVNYASKEAYLRAQYALWFGKAAPEDIDDPEWRLGLGRSLREHSVFRNLLQFFDKRRREHGNALVSEAVLLQELALINEELQDADLAYQVFDSLCSLASYARFRHSDDGTLFPLLKIHVHLWFRELSRMVATVAPGDPSADAHSAPERYPQLRFSAELPTTDAKRCLPVIHCRDCGTMGWGAVQRPNEDCLRGELDSFYQAFFGKDPKLRFVYPVEPGRKDGFGHTLCGNCLHVAFGELSACPKCGNKDQLVPVAVHVNNRKQQDRLVADTACPHCQSPYGVTILGSRSASLSSVALGQAFATRFNDDKQTLAFSDNVQDASHRAAFFAARTYRTTLRTAICESLRANDARLNLPGLEAAFLEYWQARLSPAEFIGTFLAPNMEWIEEYERLRRDGTLAADSRLPEDVGKRLRWELLAEFGFNARIGRTLEKSGVAIGAMAADELAAAAEVMQAALREQFGGLGSVSINACHQFLSGLVQRLRTMGGIGHELLGNYFSDPGVLFHLNRQKWTPGFSYRGRAPAALVMGPATPGKMERVVGAGNARSWLEQWADKLLTLPGGLGKEGASVFIDTALKVLTQAGLLQEGNAANGNRFWVLNGERLWIERTVLSLRCDCCGHGLSISRGEFESMGGQLRCLRGSCTGHYHESARAKDYFGDLYWTGDVARIHAEEHTGLIERKEREWIEQRFMASDDRRRTDPNLLSCTPTLEMGIDIGDLSSVLLCSVPPQAANYVQRVGRAGRRDGNAFSLTVANANPHDLYFYRLPEEIIVGAVNPPGVFFNAPAVLQRQFLAYAIDSWICEQVPTPIIPKLISPALSNVYSPSQPPSGFPYDLLGFIRQRRQPLLTGFFNLFGNLLSEDSRQAIRQWVEGTGTLDSVESRVVKRMRAYANELEDLKKRRTELRTRLRKLELVEPKDEALQEEIDSLGQMANGLSGIIRTIRQTQTLQFFTDEGLLPNYAFPEEGVTLRSIILRKKEKASGSDGGNYTAETLEYQRPAASAIRELAPGSAFYAQHRKLTVDQVNLRLSEPELWNFCDQCAYIERIHDPAHTHDACPVCASSGWKDGSLRRWMIPMRQVITTEFDRFSRTHDESDERTPEFFDSQTSVAIPLDAVEKAYQVKDAAVPFGFEFVRQATMRMVNLGTHGFGDEVEKLGGRERTATGFHLCPKCGKVKGARKDQKEFRHDIACPNRDKPDAQNDLEAFFLYRELTSEALRILVPSVTSGEGPELSSFVAALQLGLEAYFKGSIEHLASCTESRPIPGSEFSRTFLVVYDKVPGGTGYLKELSRQSDQFLQVLKFALDILKRCACKNDHELDGCHRCVLKNNRNRGGAGEPRRSTAIQILEQILSQGDALEDISSIAAIDVNPLIESQLENAFIDALALLPDATLQTELIGGKNGYVLTFGKRMWELVPQVELGAADGLPLSTRPDFVLTPVRPAESRPIAVYLDGFAYHADESTGHNRVAKDLLQRETLRHSGRWLVWSLTWDDLKHAAVAPASAHPGQSAESAQRRMALLRGLSGDVVHAAEKLESASSWQLLVRYLSSATSADIARQYAYCFAFSLGKGQPQSVPTHALRACFENLMEDEEPLPLQSTAVGTSEFYGFAEGDASSRWRFAFGSTLDAMRNKEIAGLQGIVRFDDDTVLLGPEFKADWRGLLRLHNLLQFLPEVKFVTRRMIVQGIGPTPALPGSIAATPATPSHGAPPAHGAWQLDLSLVDPQVLDLIAELQDMAVAEPECGYELPGPDGSIIAEAELAWTDAKVALLTDAQAPFEPAFTAAGWQIFRYLTEGTVSAKQIQETLL